MKFSLSLDSLFSVRRLAYQLPLLAILTGALMAASSGSASAMVTNGSFETGDLTGWETQGNVEVLTADNFDAPIPVPDGEFYALVSNGGDLAEVDDETLDLIDELDLLIDDLFDVQDDLFDDDFDDAIEELEDFIDDVKDIADDIGGDIGDFLNEIAADKEALINDIENIDSDEDFFDVIDALDANIEALFFIIDVLLFEGSPAPDDTPFSDADGDGQPDNDQTVLSQTFSGHGDICFSWAWLTDEEDEPAEFDDIFYVMIDGEIVLSGSVDKDPEQSPFPDIPTDDESYEVFSDGPTDFSLFGSGRSEFAEYCGYVGIVETHTIHFVVADQGNHGVDSGLLIDNVRLVVPEPQEPENINEEISLIAPPSTSFDLSTRIFTIWSTFQNTGGAAIEAPFFEVAVLEGAGCPCEVIGFGGVGATVPIDAGDDGVLEPGETFEHHFEIQLSTPAPFTFFVNALGFIP